MQLTQVERWILSNQYLIMEQLDSDNAESYNDAREIIDNGYENHYSGLSIHILKGSEIMTEDECKEVLNILGMYQTLQEAYDDLPSSDKTGIDENRLRFPGFDGNYETKYMAYARYYCKDGAFGRLARPSDFNSHAPLLTLYRNQLAEWEESADKHNLTKEDITRLTSVTLRS